MKKRLLICLFIAGISLVGLAQNEEKFSVTTQMFLSELNGELSLEPDTKAQTQLNLIPVDHSWQRRGGKNDGRLYAAPDTINGTAYIAAYLRLYDANSISEVEAKGVILQESFNNGLFTSLIPVDKIKEVAAISNVKRINVSPLKKTFTNTAREKTNVDDILTLSTDAISAGLTSKYDGSGVILGVIDTGIDFNHIAFKDKDGNSRIKQAYVYNGSTAKTYTGSQITSTLTDDNTGDHGTHTSTTAGGSSVIVNGSTVTVTDDHANATYGGMAPGADLYLAGIKNLSSTYLDNAVKAMCTYADNQGKPLVVSNSWGSQWGPHDGTGDEADVYNSLFGDSHPNHVALFAASNDGGKSKDNEGGGYHVTGTASSSNPLGTICRSASYINTDAGYYYYGPFFNAWARTTSTTSLAVKIYVLDSSTGAVKTSVTVTPTSTQTTVSGLSSYYSGTLIVLKDYIDSDKTQLMLYANGGLTSQSTSTTTKDGSTYYKSNYTLAVQVYPTSGSCMIDAWGGNYGYFTNHLSTSGYTWTAGSDDGCYSDEATISNAISIGAYVSANTWTDYNGTAHDMSSTYTMGDIAYFSSWGTAANNPAGTMIPWISAPGARLAAGVNHNHTASVDNYSYYDTYAEDLVVNSSTNPYAMMEGTSMATPTAAGIVALWLQASLDDNAEHKNLTVNDVKNIMKETAITDAFTTTGANAAHFGNGKIDALAGIKYILGASDEPTIKATPTELAFTGYATMTYTKEVTVTGFNLEGNITVTKSGNSAFSVDKTTITQTDGSASATLTITWSPTTAGNTTGTITLTSSNAESVTISLTGTAEAATPTIITDQESMAFEAIKGSTDTQALNVSGKFLTENVTVAVSGTGFSINTTSIANADALSDDGKDITVTFTAPSATGTYEGTLTLTSTGAETVTVNLTGISNPKQTSKEIYKLVSSVTSGSQYLIASTNTAGTSNTIGSSASNSITNYSVTIKTGDPGDGNSCTYIEDPSTYSVWTSGTNSSSMTFANNGYYLYHSSGNLSLSTQTSKNTWTVGTGATTLYYSGGNSIRYLQYNSSWYLNTSSSNVYFYEKTTITIDEDEDPTLAADPTSLSMETDINVPVTATFNVTGTNLTDNVSVTLNDANNVFSIDKSSITQSDGSANATVTVTFTPSTAGTFTGTVTLSSAGVENIVVTLNGVANTPSINASKTAIELSSPIGVATTETFTVTGTHLASNVTATLNDANSVFSIDPTSFTKAQAEDGTDNTITVTFTPSAAQEYTATIILSSDKAEDVTINLKGTGLLPYIVAKPETLTFDEIEADGTESMTFEVLAGNLADVVTATLADESGVFSIDATNINIADAEEGKTVTVTFAPQVAGTYTGTVTLSSPNAESVVVYLNATAKKKTPDYFDVTISNVGVTTLYLDFPVEIPYDEYEPDLLGAYYIYDLQNNVVRYARLSQYIPQNTGVVIHGNPGKYRFPKATGDVPALKYDNKLTGSTVRISVSDALTAAQSSGVVLTLGRGSNSYIGFYRYTGTYLNANKAFLIYEDSAESAKGFALNFDGAVTDIQTIQGNDVEDVWYTIQGIRINGKPTKRGVYLHNGKKISVK